MLLPTTISDAPRSIKRRATLPTADGSAAALEVRWDDRETQWRYTDEMTLFHPRSIVFSTQPGDRHRTYHAPPPFAADVSSTAQDPTVNEEVRLSNPSELRFTQTPRTEICAVAPDWYVPSCSLSGVAQFTLGARSNAPPPAARVLAERSASLACAGPIRHADATTKATSAAAARRPVAFRSRFPSTSGSWPGRGATFQGVVLGVGTRRIVVDPAS